MLWYRRRMGDRECAGLRVHPDDVACALYSLPGTNLCGPRYERSVLVRAERCADPRCGSTEWRLRASVGKAKNRIRFQAPRPFCRRCGRPWPEHSVSAPVSPSGRPWNFELIMDDALQLGVIKAIAARMLGHWRTRWRSRLYFAYIGDYRHRGGIRALVHEGPEEFPRFPHRWTFYRVQSTVQAGRLSFARRCVTSGILEPFEPLGEGARTTVEKWWEHPEPPLGTEDYFPRPEPFYLHPSINGGNLDVHLARDVAGPRHRAS